MRRCLHPRSHLHNISPICRRYGGTTLNPTFFFISCLIFFLQACHEEGKHILFRNDPIMNGHFLNIARRAKAAPNESLILVSFLAALTLLCVVIAATIFAMRRRSCIRSQSNTFYEQTSPRLRQSDYTLITSEDA